MKGQYVERLFVFGLVVFCSCFFHQRAYLSSTPVSRLDLLHSIYESGSLNIDRYHTNTLDKAFCGGHYYSDKAPGTVAIALPFFYLGASCAWFCIGGVNSENGWFVTSWIACALCLGVLNGFGSIACYEWLSAYVSLRAAYVTTCALFLGAAPLPYSTILYSHSAVVSLLFISIKVSRSLCPFSMFSAGVFAGLALASEFTAALVFIAVGLLASKSGLNGLAFICGSLITLSLIPAYNMATVGKMWTIPYAYQVSFPMMKRGLFGIQWPDMAIALRLLFSPERGLFLWSPFLVLSLAGFKLLMQRDRKLGLLLYVTVILQVVVISGKTWDWQAGPSIGARYLSPLLVAFALPCGLAAQRFQSVGIGAAFLSFGITSIATATTASLPRDDYNPFVSENLARLLIMDINPNLFTAMGMSSLHALFCFYGLALVVFVCGFRRLRETNSC